MTLICLGIPKFTMTSVGPPSGVSDPAMVNALASCCMSHRNLFEEDAGNNTDPQMLYGSSCCYFWPPPKRHHRHDAWLQQVLEGPKRRCIGCSRASMTKSHVVSTDVVPSYVVPTDQADAASLATHYRWTGEGQQHSGTCNLNY